ncbi:MAG: DUF3467 domain-containing protein [Capnocytophaga sp.]|nr:DUF3467 domain-containing protein [Capnocytophaga sp.]
MDNEISQEISIELDEQTANGVYSNLVVVNHSETEFVLDFVSLMPGVPKGRVQSRIILAPLHAKRLLNALSDNIQKFENQLNTINDNEIMQTVARFGSAGEA